MTEQNRRSVCAVGISAIVGHLSWAAYESLWAWALFMALTVACLILREWPALSRARRDK